MTVFVFGNPDLPQDSLPLRILPKLKRSFPKIDFLVQDPHEEWETGEEITVVDTVEGLAKVEVFDSLEHFTPAPRVTAHDFDALANLRYLQKLGKIKKVRVIGIPSEGDEEKILKKVSAILSSRES